MSVKTCLWLATRGPCEQASQKTTSMFGVDAEYPRTPPFSPPRGSSVPASPSSRASSRSTAAHMQVVLARQRLVQAEAALQAAVELEAGPPSVPPSRAQLLAVPASRIRSVLLARHEARVSRTFRAWCRACDAMDEDAIAAANGSTDDQQHAATQGETGAESFLEVVVAHLRPMQLQWALGTWWRVASSIGRAASQAALLEGKWAMQKAEQLNDAHREQIVRGVMRWWRNSDLARSWAQWQAVATVLPAGAGAAQQASPHVHVSLA